MKSNKGVTLIILIVTVIVLTLLTGVTYFSITNTIENSHVIQFESYMKMIQKGVDIEVEEGQDYTKMGSTLSDTVKEKLQNIIDSDTNVETRSTTSDKLRYFNSTDIDKYFGVAEVNDEIIVNFENREVISLNGVKNNGVMHYVERGLY